MAGGEVKLINLVKKFGEFTAVDGIDLRDAERRVLLAARPLGLRQDDHAAHDRGFELPGEGEIRSTAGHDAAAYERPVNMVFQTYALFPHLTVEDNVASACAKGAGARAPRARGRVARARPARRASRAPPAAALRRTAPAGRARPRARAGARVLLLDEPLGALDSSSARSPGPAQAPPAQLGITFIFVTHDQEEALTMSDRIAVMNRGASSRWTAARGLRAAGDRVRGQLHGRRQPDDGHRRGRVGRPLPRSRSATSSCMPAAATWRPRARPGS